MSQSGTAAGKAIRRKRYAVRFKERTGLSLSRAHRQFNRIPYLLSRAKMRAEKRGLVFDISKADLPLPILCPILGVVLDYVNEAGVVAGNLPSLDRVNNDLGYVKGNVRIISHRANMLKSRFDAATFRRLADYCEGKI